MVPGPDRAQVCQALREVGFQRLEQVDTLQQALAVIRADHHATCPLLVVDVPPKDGFSAADIRSLQEELGASQELPVALITQEDTFSPAEDQLIRPMPWPAAGNLAWLPYWDELVGLD
jgi:hypothetical protein